MIIIIIIIIGHVYILDMQSMAVPLLIQWSCVCVVGIGNATTKLVECPVVDRVPALIDVLYKGQL